MVLFKKGSSGREALDIQSRLVSLGFLSAKSSELADSFFGSETERAIREFQESRGLRVDGIVGPDTWHSLVEAGYTLGCRFLYLKEPRFRGDDVAELQRRLNALGFYSGKEDGIFDEQAASAVEQFQRNSGLHPDGIAGPKTIEALLRLSRITRHEGIAYVRESERGLPECGMKGRKIMIDPGHGSPVDPGKVGHSGMCESDLAERISEHLGQLLIKGGALVTYSRRRGECPSESERASRANEMSVDLVLSIHANESADPVVRGVSSSYYARGGYRSPYGFRLAHHLQSELTSELQAPDLKANGAAFILLRETKMPVVVTEPIFITNPVDEKIAEEEGFILRIATAILRATEKYFSGVKSSAEE
ncbi:MAG: peptidoglycan-binding protein [Actinomycetota bacterium]|nr:peptidoglycan-binding protein [Actinomycetota bacterium]